MRQRLNSIYQHCQTKACRHVTCTEITCMVLGTVLLVSFEIFFLSNLINQQEQLSIVFWGLLYWLCFPSLNKPTTDCKLLELACAQSVSPSLIPSGSTHSQSAVNRCAALPPAEGLTAHSEAQRHRSCWMGVKLILFTFSLKKAGHTTRFVSNASVRTSAPVKRGSVLDIKVCPTILFMAPLAWCGMLLCQLCNTSLVTKGIPLIQRLDLTCC